MRMTENQDFKRRGSTRLSSWTAVAVTPLSKKRTDLRISKRRRAPLAAALQDTDAQMNVSSGMCIIPLFPIGALRRQKEAALMPRFHTMTA
jgi:hypothetical protein